MCESRCTEPSLDELFSDTAVQLLMRRDGVKESDIRALLDQLKIARCAVSVAIARKARRIHGYESGAQNRRSICGEPDRQTRQAGERF